MLCKTIDFNLVCYKINFWTFLNFCSPSRDGLWWEANTQLRVTHLPSLTAHTASIMDTGYTWHWGVTIGRLAVCSSHLMPWCLAVVAVVAGWISGLSMWAESIINFIILINIHLYDSYRVWISNLNMVDLCSLLSLALIIHCNFLSNISQRAADAVIFLIIGWECTTD